MQTKYWIKLYHEILHDPKMAMLDADTWRLAIECFLMAGEEARDGYLPPLKDIAWILRRDIEQLETTMNELVRIEILEVRDGRYFVRKFAERQEPMPKAEYNRRKRGDDVLLKYYQPVTNGNAEPEKIRVDKDTEQIIPAPDGIPATTSPKRTPGDLSKVVFSATNQPYVPDRDRVEQIETLLDYYGYDAVLIAFKDAYGRWISTPRKDKSGNYSGTNFKWVDWAQDTLAGNRPPPKTTAEMTDAEYTAYKLQEANR